MEDLRKKYARFAEERDATLDAAMAGSDVAARVAFESSADRVKEDGAARAKPDALESLRICPSCNGLGVTTSLYNHMVTTRTCQGCGGDGVVAAPGTALGESTTESEAPASRGGPPPLE